MNVGIHMETIHILEERVESLQESFVQIELYSGWGWNKSSKYNELLAEANARENWLMTKIQETEKVKLNVG